jgi:deoxyribose-phosphate aldolase
MKANQINIANFRQTPVIDQVGVNERVSRLNSRSIKKTSKIAALKLVLSMIDLSIFE